MNCRATLICVVLSLFLVGTAATVVLAQYSEAPVLQEKVEAGELPPVNERLPEEPLVVEPFHEIGQYGGTWYRYGASETWAHIRNKMYGHSPVRWVDDGLGIQPNWVQSWESNEDASVWTLHIRRGIRWSDGHPMTSADFMFWWEDMVLNEGHSDPVPDMYAVGLAPAEMSAPDDYTLVMDFPEPAPLLIERMANWINNGFGERQIVPKHYLMQFHPDYSDEYDDFEVFEEQQEWWVNPDTPVLTAWMPVTHRVGEQIILERNPFYWVVDTEGNQLPYIDSLDTTYVQDNEAIRLQWMDGQVGMQMQPYTDMTDFQMLLDNQERGGYTVNMWDEGSGTGPILYTNWNHPDDKKRELYRMPEFRQALSHGINRERIQNMLYFGMGTQTTGTFSPKSIEFHRTEEGQQLYREWNDAYLYDPERAEELLDQIGVVDTSGDGWRQMPDGADLTLRIDYNAEARSTSIHTNQMAQADWEQIGLKTELNPMDGATLGVVSQNAEFDIRNGWECGDGPNFWVFPQWLIPIDLSRWAPLYGSWYQQEQAGTAHRDADLAPRDRTPPREEPAENDPIRRLQRIYDQARVEPDEAKRDELAFEVMRIHIEEGPFMIGSVKGYPIPVIVNDNFRNVPDGEELALGGFVHPWIMAYPAITMPEQYFIVQD